VIKVILISGKAGVGKTTLANAILKKLQSKLSSGELKDTFVDITPFALELKRVAEKMGWDWKKDDKGRKLLQDIGRVGRDYNIHIWGDVIKKQYYNMNKNVILIIDDWRFPDEYDNMLNGADLVYTVKIIAPNREILKGKAANDVSETSLDNFTQSNFDFHNNDGIELFSIAANIVIEDVLNE
jgi:Cdc6-like AAA superfamily ATPase